jgi:hypothetical protein
VLREKWAPAFGSTTPQKLERFKSRNGFPRRSPSAAATLEIFDSTLFARIYRQLSNRRTVLSIAEETKAQFVTTIEDLARISASL